MSDVGLVVGPLGFEPRTDGLKVSGSSFKTARKMHEKRPKTPENAGFRPKEHATTQSQPTFQIQSMTNMTRMGGVETQASGQNRTRVLI